MSTYSNRLQPDLQNLLQCVVLFFHPRSSCTTHISTDVFGGRKSLVKPVTWQKTCNYIELFGSSTQIVMHDDAYIGGQSENNIKCVVHDDLRWKNQTTRYILPCHWLYEWFSQFHSCGTYSVLLQSHSTALQETVKTFIFCEMLWHLLPLSVCRTVEVPGQRRQTSRHIGECSQLCRRRGRGRDL